MKSYLMQLMDIQRGEGRRVTLLLTMSFLMGMFLATVNVASRSLFLEHFDENRDLPEAFLLSGAIGLVATILYNFLQNRIPFILLASLSLLVMTGVTAFLEFGEGFFSNPNTIFKIGFTQLIPFSFLIYLIFWGTFGRLFNTRQAKRLLGTVDVGAMIASFIAFFSIPQLLKFIDTVTLYSIALVSIGLFLILFIYVGVTHLNKVRSFAQERKYYRKIGIKEFFQTRYITYMSLFVIVAMMAMNFVDYSFLNVTTLYLDDKMLPNFIAYFEMTVVIFNFLFQTTATDRIMHEYGMRVTMLINPVLIGLFTITAIGVGYIFGYSPQNDSFVVFFISIAMSKLLIQSLRDALDNQTFRLYLLPIESNVRIDVQTKIEGMVTAFATLMAGALIILINQVNIFDLFTVTLFTLPLIVSWYFIANAMHKGYRFTLQNTLIKNKATSTNDDDKQYTVNEVLEKNLDRGTEDKIIYALKMMEQLDPALFENTIVKLTGSESKKIKLFAQEKIQLLGLEKDQRGESKKLAEAAFSDLEDSDLLSISPEKLLKLSKSIRQNDRMLAAKLLRRLIETRTIFVLLELLRDADPKVRYEALFTARKVKRPETWPVLIELLGSPSYSHHAAAALKEAGESILPVLEAAFHKSGQSETIMLRIVQIMGRIGGKTALKLLWAKADYPDKRIVKQIFYSLRYINYRAVGRQAIDVQTMLETEISKTIWNLAAVGELPDTKHFFFLREALQEEIAENYDQIMMLMSILYDPQSVQLVRENFASEDPDSIAFALELLDLFIDQSLKPKLFPLFDHLPVEEKLRQLQTHFPRENYTPIQVINYILNRDYNLNNRWTKACAVHAAAFMQDFRVSRGLIAQVFNKDRLLQETAAWVIYHKDKAAYEAISDRLPKRDKKYLDSSIENNQLLNGLEDGFLLNIEMIMLLKQLPVFKGIHGVLVSDLADKIIPIDLAQGERMSVVHEAHNAPILIVASGEVALKAEGQNAIALKTGDLYGDPFHNTLPVPVQELEATQHAVIFRINLMDFYFVLANHHELVRGLLKNVPGEVQQNN